MALLSSDGLAAESVRGLVFGLVLAVLSHLRFYRSEGKLTPWQVLAATLTCL
jgi:hypothetical protein